MAIATNMQSTMRARNCPRKSPAPSQASARVALMLAKGLASLSFFDELAADIGVPLVEQPRAHFDELEEGLFF